MAKKTKHELALDAVTALRSKLVRLDFDRYEDHHRELPESLEEMVYKKADPLLVALADLIVEHELKETRGG